MKLLHCADLHLDTPFSGRSESQQRYLRRNLLAVPEKLADLCRRENCDLMLLAGDLFDGPRTMESLNALRSALEEAAVPVFISPGNHDYLGADSPYLSEAFPKNVHIFKKPIMESVVLEELDCRIYGAGYRSMDCGSLLEGFSARGDERYHIAVLHGDPTQVSSPYCPITKAQVRQSALHYLALGHIHQAGSFRAGETLCAWPGCPMGRGYDESGVKGAYIVTIGDNAETRFVPLDTPRFYDLETAPAGLPRLLPAVGSEDFYRITLTGESPPLDLSAIAARYARFPYLELRDKTLPEPDIWGSAGDDTLEGTYFRLLKDAMESADEDSRGTISLAARISRQILDGQEVVLP